MEPGNTAVIRALYAAFARRDGAAMAACYAPDARFSDPVFTDLRGAEIGAMWTMLCGRAKELEIRLVDAASDGDRGRARWEADYLFAATGRTVHNVIDARFVFRDGKIVEHVDTFPLWKWTRMALGAKGLLLGWLPPVQAKVRAQADRGLREFIARN